MDTPFNEQSGAFKRLPWLTAEPRQNICAVSWGNSPYTLSPALRDLSILLPLVHTLSINFLSSIQLHNFIIHDSIWKFRLLLPKPWWEENWSRNKTRKKENLDIGCPPGYIHSICRIKMWAKNYLLIASCEAPEWAWVDRRWLAIKKISPTTMLHANLLQYIIINYYYFYYNYHHSYYYKHSHHYN